MRTQIMIVIWRKTPQMTVQWLAELGFEVIGKQAFGDLLQRALAGKCHLEEGRATWPLLLLSLAIVRVSDAEGNEPCFGRSVVGCARHGWRSVNSKMSR